jgi:hypothetical protein
MKIQDILKEVKHLFYIRLDDCLEQQSLIEQRIALHKLDCEKYGLTPSKTIDKVYAIEEIIRHFEDYKYWLDVYNKYTNSCEVDENIVKVQAVIDFYFQLRNNQN